MLVHEPNGNLPTLNNPRTVDHFYRMYVLPVTTPAKTTNKAIHFISVASIVATVQLQFSGCNDASAFI